ncbi:hypothetical protein GZL_05188 [Streptomyces sp. 769]|nr:hypothetical protein GZL_05188 [Streptomyces sp. 769]
MVRACPVDGTAIIERPVGEETRQPPCRDGQWAVSFVTSRYEPDANPAQFRSFSVDTVLCQGRPPGPGTVEAERSEVWT